MNRFGHIYTLTSFGESHGPAIGGVLDGVPAGFAIDSALIQQELDRRRPGSTPAGTARREADRVQLLSGIYEGKTLGSPIGFIVPNTDGRPADYTEMAQLFRPSHADFTYQSKYGLRDPRGGGRASARETVSRVVAGAVARQILSAISQIDIRAYTSRIGTVALPDPYPEHIGNQYASIVRAPEESEEESDMIEQITQAREHRDSVGGSVSCRISGVPGGLGEPIGAKLHAMLGSAMLSIPAVKGFEYGMGAMCASARGSEVADLFVPGKPIGHTATNFSGGIQGGISSGADICFTVHFKPAPTLMRDMTTIDTCGRPATLHGKGRHDPCVVPRAVSVVEAMACMVILDAMLMAHFIHP